MTTHSVGGSGRPIARPFALLLAVALVAAALLGASPARAVGNDFYICPQIEVGESVFDLSGEADQGSSISIELSFSVEEWSGVPTGQADSCVSVITGWAQDVSPNVTVTLSTQEGTGLDWRLADDTLVPNQDFLGTGGFAVDFSWTLSGDGSEITTDEALGSYANFDLTPRSPPAGLEGRTLRSAVLPLDLRSDVAPGDYTVAAAIELTASGGATETYTAETGLTILAPAAPAPAGPGAVVSCSEPSVGGVVSCDLTSEPSFDFVWEASTNPVFASGVVTTDASGAGRFAFTVPASAVGQPVLVEIVDWTVPTSIGVAAAPVPTSLPAGEGPTTPAGGGLLLGVVLLAGVLAVRTSRRGAQVDATG